VFYNNYKKEGIQRAVKYIIELAAIKKIIPVVRRFLAKRYWQSVIEVKRKRAVTVLQNAARSRAAAQLLANLKKNSMSQKEKTAAIFIQATMRSALAVKEAEYRRQLRVMEQLQLNSAKLLQRSVRNMFVKASRKRELEEAKRIRCIVFIQCRIRKFLAKCRYNLLKKEYMSSLIIQRVWKRELANRDAKHDRKMKAIYKIQQVLRRKWIAFGIMQHAAKLKELQSLEEDNDASSIMSRSLMEDISLQSSVVNKSGIDELSVSRMELTLDDDEFSLMSPLMSPEKVSLMASSIDESSIHDLQSISSPVPDREMMENSAAKRIQVLLFSFFSYENIIIIV
jgi:hypothetical protein